MKIFRSSVLALAASLGVSFVAPSRANATLLIHEDFNYAPGANALNSKNGGTGYSAAYASNNNADVVAGSFNYTDGGGNQLVTSGNRVLLDSTTVGDPAGASVSIAPIRNTTALAAIPETTLYMSFLAQQTAGTLRDVTVSLFAATNGTYGTQERLSVGHGNPTTADPDGDDHWGAYTLAVGDQGAYSTVPASQLSLVVVRIDTNVGGGALDRFRVYVNPTLGVEPAVASAESSAFDFLASLNEINRVRMRAGGSNAALSLGASQMEVDEIRIGTDYASVTPIVVPEPAAGMMSAAGVALAAARRRRRRRRR